MPYRDATPEADDFRGFSNPISRPLLPHASPRIQIATSPLSRRQQRSLEALAVALRGILDPGGSLEPLQITLRATQTHFQGEIVIPEPLPGAPPLLLVSLSDSFEVSRSDLRLVGARLRSRWMEYFASLEEARLSYRYGLLQKDPEAQLTLAAGSAVRCPRCSMPAFRRQVRRLTLGYMPVDLEQQHERCSQCDFSRLEERHCCPRCGGRLAPVELVRHVSEKEHDLGGVSSSWRQVVRWRCERCAFVAAETQQRHTFEEP